MFDRGRRVRIRRLTGRGRARWLPVAMWVAAFGALVAWQMFLDPNRNVVSVIAMDVVILGLVYLATWRRAWVSTDVGSVSRNVAGVRTRTAHWSEANRIDLERGQGAELNLRVVDYTTTIRIPLLVLARSGDRRMDPDQLRLLADEIERWAPERDEVVEALRAQAAHVESGGVLRESPLAARL